MLLHRETQAHPVHQAQIDPICKLSRVSLSEERITVCEPTQSTPIQGQLVYQLVKLFHNKRHKNGYQTRCMRNFGLLCHLLAHALR